MRREVCKELRERLVERARGVNPDGKACLALSGGVDSVTALFAMLEAGQRPRCYTFYMEGHVSDDLVAAKRLTEHFGLEHVVVMVPTAHDEIVRNVQRVIAGTCKIKKTIIECTAPWTYIGRAMAERGDKHILIGFSAGNIFCLSRRDNKKLLELGEAEFLRQGHRTHKFTDLNYVDGNVARYVKVNFGIIMDDFFATDRIFKWFHPYTIGEIHRAEDGSRFEKAPFIYAFHDYYGQKDFYRKGSSYQVNSRLRDFYEGLLWNEKYNPSHKHQGIIAIYNRIASGDITP